MTAKAVAVDGMVLAVIPPASGQVTIISAPSAITSVAGKGVFRGPLQFQVANVQSGPMGTAKPGTLPMGVINPTATLTKADKMAVIRVGDKISGLLAPDAMQPGAPSPVPSPITFGVEVKAPGQSDVKAE